jgi:hypothetical protein
VTLDEGLVVPELEHLRVAHSATIVSEMLTAYRVRCRVCLFARRGLCVCVVILPHSAGKGRVMRQL